MKRIILFILAFSIILFCYSGSICCFAEGKSVQERLEEEVDKSIEDLELDEFEAYAKDLEIFYNSGGIKEFVKNLTNGDITLTPEYVFKTCFSSLTKGLTSVIPSLIGIVLIAILFGLLFGLTQNYMKKQTVDIVYFVCYSTIITTVVAIVSGLVKDVTQTVELLSNTVNAVYPPLITLLTAVGGGTSSGLFNPGLAVVGTLASNVITKSIIPIFIASIVFGIVGNISANVKLDRLQSATRFIGGTIMTLTFGGLISYLSISGLIGGVIDSTSVRATKYLVSNYVPIVGGYLSQGVNLVRYGMIIVKNALGVSGIIAVLSIILTPVAKLTALTIGLKLTAGIIEPITDKRMSGFINGIAESIRQLLGAVLGVGFVFILTLALILFTLNSI